jgi:hypothetical protein
MPSRTLYRVAIVRADVSEDISSTSSGFLRVIGLHSCVTVKLLLTTISTAAAVKASQKTVFFYHKCYPSMWGTAIL